MAAASQITMYVSQQLLLMMSWTFWLIPRLPIWRFSSMTLYSFMQTYYTVILNPRMFSYKVSSIVTRMHLNIYPLNLLYCYLKSMLDKSTRITYHWSELLCIFLHNQTFLLWNCMKYNDLVLHSSFLWHFGCAGLDCLPIDIHIDIHALWWIGRGLCIVFIIVVDLCSFLFFVLNN